MINVDLIESWVKANSQIASRVMANLKWHHDQPTLVDSMIVLNGAQQLWEVPPIVFHGGTLTLKNYDWSEATFDNLFVDELEIGGSQNNIGDLNRLVLEYSKNHTFGNLSIYVDNERISNVIAGIQTSIDLDIDLSLFIKSVQNRDVLFVIEARPCYDRNYFTIPYHQDDSSLRVGFDDSFDLQDLMIQYGFENLM